MARRRLAMSVIAATLSLAAPSVDAAPNCDTALAGIAKKTAEKAVADNHGSACAGLKSGPIGIDQTKALDLKSFQLCELGPTVTASITIHAKCGTSDGAVIAVNIEDDLTASASADLDRCEVLAANVVANGFLATAGVQVSDLQRRLKEEVQKAIKPYCK